MRQMNHTNLRHLLWAVFATVCLSLLLTGCPQPREGYAPSQPIPFSHYKHAGQHEISCQYCHTAPAMGRHSSVPSLDICMNCHRMVRTDSPYIQQLTQAYNEGKPINWVKVHDLPDFAYFNHQPHVAYFLKNQEGNAEPGRIEGVCANCHGQVNQMDVVSTQNEFNMGWCVNCHRKHEAPLNCTTCHR